MTWFEARQFSDKRQAESLAGWTGGVWYEGTAHGHTTPPWQLHVCVTPGRVAVDCPKQFAEIGDWIIKAADGAVRIEPAGNQDGYCTDCGKPVWWQSGSGADGGDRLVTREGNRWCFGKDESNIGMTRHHALPGMVQYVVQSPEGQVCHCLDKSGAHIHQIIPVTDDQAEGKILRDVRWAPYTEFGIPDPEPESWEAPAGAITIGATGYRDDDVIIYWSRPADPGVHDPDRGAEPGR